MNADRETRDRLLKSAERLFADRGFRNVTVREICRAAHANVAAVNYHFSDKLGLRMSRAQEVDETTAPQFYGMVRELAQKADLPMPKVYLIDKLPTSVHPLEVLLVAAVTMVLCIGAAIIPALKAASMRPVDGLRHE